jgi:hypothetical protein
LPDKAIIARLSEKANGQLGCFCGFFKKSRTLRNQAQARGKDGIEKGERLTICDGTDTIFHHCALIL